MKKRLVRTISYLIGSIGLGVIGNFVYDSVKQVPLLGFITRLFKSLYELITATQIKLWAVLVLGAMIYLTISLLKWLEDKATPRFTRYTKDKFRIWTWKWKWRKVARSWVVEDLRPFCPSCDVQLVDTSTFYHQSSKCPGCDHIFTGYDEPVEEIVRLVEAKANKIGKNAIL